MAIDFDISRGIRRRGRGFDKQIRCIECNIPLNLVKVGTLIDQWGNIELFSGICYYNDLTMCKECFITFVTLYQKKFNDRLTKEDVNFIVENLHFFIEPTRTKINNK